MTHLHQHLAKGEWFNKSLPEQLGNVGSEFERALRWKEKRQEALFQSATGRMLELMDLTIADPRWHNHRLKELTRVREVACEELFGKPENPEGLKRYFLQFAALARSRV